jgi:predicted exporter
MFGLPNDVYVVLAEGRDLEPLLETNERLVARLSVDLPDVSFQAPTQLLPSAAAQNRATQRIAAAHVTPATIGSALEAARIAGDFTADAFKPFAARIPKLLNPAEHLTYDGYVSHGLTDLVDRLIVREDGRWTLATYVFPTTPDQVARVQGIVDDTDRQQSFTGLTLVNRELARSFLPQFLKGLTIGTVIVVALVVIAFRSWRLSLLAMLPTAIGLVWAAGLLALAGVELDLFAVFAVVTFVGIGVDYGIHLVHRYQERGEAERATSELAPVILVAAAITMAGYGTLVWSSYPPLRSIGIVSAVSVVTLAIASVLVLPALLLTEQAR